MSQPDSLRSTQELIDEALNINDIEANRYWEIVSYLHLNRDEDGLEPCKALCRNTTNRDARKLGVYILAQLGTSHKAHHKEILELFLEMLERETDTEVIREICIANGHRQYHELVKPLVALWDHHDHELRFGVIFGLMCQEDEAAITTLIKMMGDEDANNRDWATFAIGSQIDIDTPEIRSALFKRLSDSDPIVRGEALVGLASRHDERTIKAIANELLRGYPETADNYVYTAVQEMIGHPNLVSMLTDLKDKLAWIKESNKQEYIDELIELAESGPKADG